MSNLKRIIEERNGDLYKNELDKTNIDFYAKLFSNEDNYEQYLELNLFKNKYAMNNIANITRVMGYPKNIKILKTLLVGLQDANWPFFEVYINTLVDSYPKEILIKVLDDILLNAEADEDYMWIAGLYILGKRLGATNNELKNYEIFGKRDF